MLPESLRMKNLGLKLCFIALALLLAVMVVSSVFGLSSDEASQDALSFVDSYCFDGKVNEMDVQDIVNTYTKATNDYFNEKIKMVMTNPDIIKDPEKGFPSVSLDDYADKGGDLCKDSKDLTCQSIAVCNPANGDPNPNPYCLGVTLTGFSPERYQYYNKTRLDNLPQLKTSYFCYTAALAKKRDAIFDGTPQGLLNKCGTGSEYANEKLCDLKSKLDAETDPVKKAEIQQEMDKELKPNYWGETMARGTVTSLTGTLVDLNDTTAKRITFLDTEPKRAKAAIDRTLDAYAQLKISWTMHVKYMDIFAQLVKYRDHLVEVRKQTDAFPLRFIDATTTKCL